MLLATFLLYAPSLTDAFAWDDRAAAMGHDGSLRHPLVAELRPFGEYLTGSWWPQRSPSCRAYRPLATWTYAVRHALCGDNPMPEHLLNVLLHVLATGLCFVLLRRLGAGFRGALLGTAVFGLHAVHSEAVIGIVGRCELLALCGGLGAVLCLQAALRAGTARFVLHLPAAALLLLVACLGKESGLAWVACAPIVAVMAYRSSPKPTLRRGDLVAFGVVVLVVAGTYLALRARMLAGLAPGTDLTVGLLENPLLDSAPLPRAASGMIAWGYGLLLTLLPFRLAVDYGPAQLPVVASLTEAWALGAVAIALGFAGLLWLVLRRGAHRRLLLPGALLFVAFSLPLTNIAAPVFMHFADRIYTIPSLLAAMLTAWLVDRTARAPRPRLLTTLAIAAWLVGSVATALPRNFVFADDLSIIRHESLANPRSARLHLAAGVLAARDGDIAAAEAHFRTAAQLAPDLPQPWLELAGLYWSANRADEARQSLDRARAANPGELRRRAERLALVERTLAGKPPR